MDSHTPEKPPEPPTVRVIPTRMPGRSLAAARLALAGLLAADPPQAQVLAAAGALAALDEVTPPHPPLVDEVDPLPWNDGAQQVLVLLGSATDEADTIEELARIANAALELRHAPPVLEPDTPPAAVPEPSS